MAEMAAGAGRGRGAGRIDSGRRSPPAGRSICPGYFERPRTTPKGRGGGGRAAATASTSPPTSSSGVGNSRTMPSWVRGTGDEEVPSGQTPPPTQ
jgi:hypothetical protein